MSTDKKSRGAFRDRPPTFITKAELAHEMGHVDTQTIDSWIARGDFPPPHSNPGINTAVWRRKDFRAYVETGAWPAEAFPTAKV